MFLLEPFLPHSKNWATFYPFTSLEFEFIYIQNKTGKKFFYSNPTMGTFTCNKDALGKAAAFTSGAYIKFSVLVSNRNNNVRSYNASTFQWALDY